MLRSALLPLALLVVLLWSTLPAEADATTPIEAIAAARYDLNLAFTVPGKVARLLVQPGDKVKAGQPLIELECAETKAMVEAYVLKAGSDLAIRAAQDQLEIDKVEEARLKDLVAQHAAAPIEHQRQVVKTRLSGLNVDKTRQDQMEIIKQLEQAKSRLDQYTLTAPIDGTIQSIHVNVGEAVEALKAPLRMVVTDPLWIDVPVSTRDSLALKLSDKAHVRSILPGYDRKVMIGKIVFVAAAADAASDTRIVRVELPNPDNMPAGTHVMVSFDPAR